MVAGLLLLLFSLFLLLSEDATTTQRPRSRGTR